MRILWVFLGTLLVLSEQAIGDHISVVSVGVNSHDHLYDYSYQVQNSPASTDNIYSFGLFGLNGVAIENLQAPTGWSVLYEDSSVVWTGYIFAAQLAPGASISGFSFTSIGPPNGSLNYFTLGYDPVQRIPTDIQLDTTIGPTTTPEPMPGMLIFVGSLVIVGLRGAFWRPLAPRSDCRK